MAKHKVIPRQKLIELRGKRARPEVAKYLGITPQALGMYERGERTPSLNLAKRIADFYGVSVEDIFFENKGNETCLDNPHPRDHKATHESA